MLIAEFQNYWRTSHDPTIRGMAGAMRMRRYLQVHPFEDDIERDPRTSRGTRVAPYTGHAEAWFDRADLALMGSTPQGKRAMQIAIEDEAHLIDFANSAIWLAKEWVFIDRR